MIDQELLQDAWAKARTLKAEPDLAKSDPDRTLLIDALQAIHAVSPFGREFDAASHKSQKEIHAFLTGGDNPQFYRENARTVLDRAFLLEKLTEQSLHFAEGSRLYPEQSDVVVDMQRRIQHADPAFKEWLGNPYGEADIPRPRWLDQIPA